MKGKVNMREFKLGKYRHYKGNMYEVLGAGTHSETLEELVIYQALYESKDFEKGHIWLRPKDLFLGKVEEGKENPTGQKYRFEYVGK